MYADAGLQEASFHQAISTLANWRRHPAEHHHPSLPTKHLETRVQ